MLSSEMCNERLNLLKLTYDFEIKLKVNYKF